MAWTNQAAIYLKNKLRKHKILNNSKNQIFLRSVTVCSVLFKCLFSYLLLFMAAPSLLPWYVVDTTQNHHQKSVSQSSSSFCWKQKNINILNSNKLRISTVWCATKLNNRYLIMISLLLTISHFVNNTRWQQTKWPQGISSIDVFTNSPYL